MDDVFNEAAIAEYEKATQQLDTEKTTQAALRKSLQRYDNLIAKSVEESVVKPACKAGCAYCCYYKVEVRAAEMFLIKDYLLNNCHESHIKKVLTDAKSNAAIIKTLTHEQHLTTNIKCPFLIENKCSVYQVRPFKCRNFHATDVSACEDSFNDPGDLTIKSGFIESVAMFGNAHSQGFEGAVKNAGLDSRAYDLNTALIEVFAESSALKRFNRGKKTFLKAVQVDEDL
ncbi:MAG: YkgJ family cysteine cluster protein [Pseudomonadota bacterium]